MNTNNHFEPLITRCNDHNLSVQTFNRRYGEDNHRVQIFTFEHDGMRVCKRLKQQTKMRKKNC